MKQKKEVAVVLSIILLGFILLTSLNTTFAEDAPVMNTIIDSSPSKKQVVEETPIILPVIDSSEPSNDQTTSLPTITPIITDDNQIITIAINPNSLFEEYNTKLYIAVTVNNIPVINPTIYATIIKENVIIQSTTQQEHEQTYVATNLLEEGEYNITIQTIYQKKKYIQTIPITIHKTSSLAFKLPDTLLYNYAPIEYAYTIINSSTLQSFKTIITHKESSEQIVCVDECKGTCTIICPFNKNSIKLGAYTAKIEYDNTSFEQEFNLTLEQKTDTQLSIENEHSYNISTILLKVSVNKSDITPNDILSISVKNPQGFKYKVAKGAISPTTKTFEQYFTPSISGEYIFSIYFANEKEYITQQYTILFTETAESSSVQKSIQKAQQEFIPSIQVINESSFTYVSPTPDNNTNLTISYIEINVSNTETLNHSSFIDWNYSLKGYWNFEYLNNTGVYDNSTHNKFASFIGSINASNLTSGPRGSALTFQDDGVGLYAGYNPVPDGDLTISSWVYPTVNTWGYILETGASDYYLRYISNRAHLRLANSTGYCDGYSAANSVPLNQWTHITATYNNETGNLKFYINGTLSTTTTLPGCGTYTAGSQLGIGATQSGAYPFNGTLDEVTLWSRELSNQEVAALYNSKENQLDINVTNLQGGTYDYKACAIDQTGSYACAEQRTVTYYDCVNLSNPSTYGNKVTRLGTTYLFNKNTTLCPDQYYTWQDSELGTLTINNNNINVNANNLTFVGNGSNPSKGNIASSSRTGFTIHNLTIKNTYYGISDSSFTTGNNRYENITLDNSSYAIYMFANTNTFKNVNMYNSRFNHMITLGANNLVLDNINITNSNGMMNINSFGWTIINSYFENNEYSLQLSSSITYTNIIENNTFIVNSLQQPYTMGYAATAKNNNIVNNSINGKDSIAYGTISISCPNNQIINAGQSNYTLIHLINCNNVTITNYTDTHDGGLTIINTTNSQIDEYTSIENEYGISIYHSENITLNNSQFSNGVYGTQQQDSTNTQFINTLFENGFEGSYDYNTFSTAYTNTTFINNTYAIYKFSSDTFINNSRFINNTIGVFADNHSTLIYNSVYENNTNNLKLTSSFNYGNTTINIFNTSFNKSTVAFESSSSYCGQATRLCRINNYYYLDIYVNNTYGNPLSDVFLQTYDSTYALVDSQFTTQSGTSTRIAAQEYSQSHTQTYPSTVSFKTNHTILSGKSGYTSQGKSTFMNESKSISFTLVKMAPVITFTQPTPDNATVSSHNYTYINTTITDGQNTSAFIDWDRKLTGYWNFENVSGNNVYGSSTYKKTIFLAADAYIDTNEMIRGQYLELDGVLDRANAVNDLSNFITSTTGTISMWIKPKGPTKTDVVVYNLPTAIGDVGGYAGILVGNTSNQDRIWIYNWDGDADVIGLNYTKNKWTHIVWMHDTNLLHAYQDGEYIGNISSGNTQVITGTPLQIGYGYNDWFNGSIDEVMIWNRTLSNSEIKALYNSKENELYRNFTDLSDATYTYYACSIGIEGDEDCTETRTYTRQYYNVIYSTFNGSTTNFSQEPNLENLCNVTLEKTVFGIIKYNTCLNANDADLDTYVTLNHNMIGVESTILPNYNNSANITFYYINITYPKIYNSDNTTCTDCTLLSSNSENTTIQVNHFSNYQIFENTSIQIWDETDTTDRIPGENTTFFANYTYQDATPVSTALCNITYNTSVGWTQPSEMTYNTTSKLFTDTTTFSDLGEYQVNVTCYNDSLPTVTLNDSYLMQDICIDLANSTTYHDRLYKSTNTYYFYKDSTLCPNQYYNNTATGLGTINFGSNNVILDANNLTNIGNGISGGYGHISTLGKRNISIYNAIINRTYYGLYDTITQESNNHIENVTFINQSFSIYLFSSNFTFENINIRNSRSYTFFLLSSKNIVFNNLNIQNSSGVLAVNSDYITYTNSYFYNNLDDIILTGHNYLSNNTIVNVKGKRSIIFASLMATINSIDLDESNTINSKPIKLYGSSTQPCQNNQEIDLGGTTYSSVIVGECINMTLKNHTDTYDGGLFLIKTNRSTFKDMHIQDNYYATYITYANNNTFTNMSFINNTVYGLYLYGSNNNNIENSISKNAANPIEIVQSNNIKFNNVAISQASQTNSISSSENVLFNNSNISSSAIGLTIVKGNMTVQNTYMNNPIEFKFQPNGNWLINITTINTTFTKTNISFDALCTIATRYCHLNNYYYLDTYVNNTRNDPLENVLTQTYDKSVTLRSSLYTQANGYTQRQTLLEYSQNESQVYPSTVNYFTNYTINASKSGYITNTTQINLTESKHITLTLTKLAPSIAFTSPTEPNNTQLFHNWSYFNVSINDTSNTTTFIDLNQSLIGYWSFDDINGLNVYDESTYRHNASMNESISIISGKFGKAINLSGAQHIEIGNNATLKNTGQSMTISFWYFGIQGNGGTFIADGLETFSTPFWTVRETEAFFDLNGGVASNIVYTLPDDTNWHHVAITLDTSTSPDNLTLYIDGTYNKTGSGNLDNHNIFHPTAPIRIGNGIWWGNTHRTGPMDEVMIFKRALTAKEIQSLYNSYETPLSVNITNLENGDYDYYACAKDLEGAKNCTETRTLNVYNINITYGTFDGSTTNLENESDLRNVCGLILEKTTSGIIKFNTCFDVNNANLNNDVTLEHAKAGINSLHLPNYNTSANITYYNINITQPIIINDDETICTHCTLLNNNEYNITINTSHFSNYTVVENSTLTIWDTSDLETVIQDMNITFYANYTFTNNTIITNSSIDNGSCSIQFNTTEISPSYSMTYNSTSTYYEYNSTFNVSKDFTYAINCSSNYPATTLSTTDTFIIHYADIQVVSINTPTSNACYTQTQEITVNATIHNNGTLSQTNIPIYLNITGPTAHNLSQLININNATNTTVQFYFNISKEGTYTINITADPQYENNPETNKQQVNITRYYPNSNIELNITNIGTLQYSSQITIENFINCQLSNMSIQQYKPNQTSITSFNPTFNNTIAIIGEFIGQIYEWIKILDPYETTTINATITRNESIRMKDLFILGSSSN